MNFQLEWLEFGWPNIFKQILKPFFQIILPIEILNEERKKSANKPPIQLIGCAFSYLARVNCQFIRGFERRKNLWKCWSNNASVPTWRGHHFEYFKLQSFSVHSQKAPICNMIMFYIHVHVNLTNSLSLSLAFALSFQWVNFFNGFWKTTNHLCESHDLIFANCKAAQITARILHI